MMWEEGGGCGCEYEVVVVEECVDGGLHTVCMIIKISKDLSTTI